MVFGEIVEPTTRALIDEETEYPDYTETTFIWEGSKEVPNTIETLIFIESDRLKKISKKALLSGKNPCASLKNSGIDIFNINNNYIVLLKQQKELTNGEIVEALKLWISQAKSIFTLTSASLSTYQNYELVAKPETVIRSLTTNLKNGLGYKKLETPNLVTGLGANVLSYCIHEGLDCSLFIMFTDSLLLDSRNAIHFIDLVKKIGLPVQNCDLNADGPSSNLYM